jgi:hypothetical protein
MAMHIQRQETETETRPETRQETETGNRGLGVPQYGARTGPRPAAWGPPRRGGIGAKQRRLALRAGTRPAQQQQAELPRPWWIDRDD